MLEEAKDVSDYHLDFFTANLVTLSWWPRQESDAWGVTSFVTINVDQFLKMNSFGVKAKLS